jgi:hypothetical protein
MDARLENSREFLCFEDNVAGNLTGQVADAAGRGRQRSALRIPLDRGVVEEMRKVYTEHLRTWSFSKHGVKPRKRSPLG